MKKSLLLPLLFNICTILFAEEISFNDFSPKYTANITITYQDTYNTDGIITIYDKTTGKELFQQEFEGIYFDKNDRDSVSVNIIEYPYGEHSLIIFDDFNFDGVNDFAIQNGRLGCYGGPSYSIYLADQNGFQYNSDFSELTLGYCGMFDYDSDRKEINIMNKSGCCWHEYSTYDLIDNKPRLIQKITEDATLVGNLAEEKYGLQITKASLNFDTQTMEEEYFSTLPDFIAERLFSFEIAKNSKQVVLFQSAMTDKLAYAFLKDNDEIEVIHDSGMDKQSDFIYTKEGDTEYLYFSNPSVTYSIYQSPKKVGLKLQTNGKTYDFIGKYDSISGSLSDLKRLFNL